MINTINKNLIKNIYNKNSIIISSIKSKHTNSSVSYKIECINKSIVYSGDTDYSNEIIKISKNADLLILECSSLSFSRISLLSALTPLLIKAHTSYRSLGSPLLTNALTFSEKISYKQST